MRGFFYLRQYQTFLIFVLKFFASHNARKLKNIENDPLINKVISVILSQSQKGLKEYGVPLSKAGLSLSQCLEMALQEDVDRLIYLADAIEKAKQLESQPGENTHSLNTPAPPSNATEIPYASLFLLNLKEFRQSVDYKTFISTFRTFFEGDWGTAKALANLLDNMEADRLMKTGDTPTPEFMLKMVGEVGKEVEAPHAIQRMFEACGVDVKFVRQHKVDMKEGE